MSTTKELFFSVAIKNADFALELAAQNGAEISEFCLTDKTQQYFILVGVNVPAENAKSLCQSLQSEEIEVLLDRQSFIVRAGGRLEEDQNWLSRYLETKKKMVLVEAA